VKTAKAVFGTCLVLLALYGVTNTVVSPPEPQSCPPRKPKPKSVGCPQEMEVIRLVNIERTKRGLCPLKPCPKLMSVAESWSNTQASRNRMYHSRYGYGENVAVGYSTPQAVMTAWMNSRGHRANILSGRYKEIGVGLVYGRGGRAYWTQEFR